MPSTFTRLLYHLVFSTKQRRPLITAELAARLHPYLGGLVRGEGGIALSVGGVADHVHLLVSYRTDRALADLLRVLKGQSSRWVHTEFPAARDFAWQEGYAAFSVSQSAVADVTGYIERQEEHHRQRDFREELLLLLQKHDIEFDERYVFD